MDNEFDRFDRRRVEAWRRYGRDYALRREYRGGWRLYVTRFSRNAGGGSGGMVDTTIYSAATTEAEAWRDIAQQVLSADWPGYPRVVQESSGVPPPSA